MDHHLKLKVFWFTHRHQRVGRLFFFFNDTATTEIYTLSLHDALPISRWSIEMVFTQLAKGRCGPSGEVGRDRKSTRLNSSHSQISYAVFCLKKKRIQPPLPCWKPPRPPTRACCESDPRSTAFYPTPST